MSICKLCNSDVGNDVGAPWISFKGNPICSDCYIKLLPLILGLENCGDGGIIRLIIKDYISQKGCVIKRRKNYSTKRNYIYEPKS